MTAANQFQVVIRTPDGVYHDSKQAAERHLRKPTILSALLAIAGGDKALADKLFDIEDALRDALDAGTIRRVSKSERAALTKALEAVAKAENPAFGFLVDHKDAILETFRWPTQARLTPEEKTAERLKAVLELCDGREDMANWVIQEKDRIFTAYNAGKTVQTLAPKAAEGLAVYQAWKAAEKALKLAKEAFDKEATEENKAAVEAAEVDHAEKKKILDDRKAAKAAEADQAENKA